MTTITLQYDARNSIAQKTIEYILSLGLFTKTSPITGLDEAIDDVKKGRVYPAKNSTDLINQCLK
ncbi:MAG: hypothetical protein LBN93_09615 [Candidatus Symbiothrix sp.]|jgi:hypothetical protein|nr:hypothetical protein [Candidatus Symbiothrix sp.]